MEITALLIALVALGVGVVALQRSGSMGERLERTNHALNEMRSALAAADEKHTAALNDLRLSVRRQAGEPLFAPTMTIADALQVHPKVNEVLASFHLGGCSHCAVSDVDTIEGACQTYGIDQKALMQALNGLTGGGSGPVKPANSKKSILESSHVSES